MEECWYKRFKCFKKLSNFLCIYLGEGGGCTNACICLGSQLSEPLNGCIWNLEAMKCSWHHKCIKVSWPYSPMGGSRAGQNRSWGSTSSLNFLFWPESYSIKLNVSSYSNDLEACINFLVPFWREIFVAFIDCTQVSDSGPKSLLFDSDIYIYILNRDFSIFLIRLHFNRDISIWLRSY